MNDELKPSSRRHRLVSSLFVLVVTSLFLTLLLQLLSHLGARDFVEKITEATPVALQKLTPTEIGRRYLETLTPMLPSHPSGPALIWPLFHAVFSLFRAMLSESLPHAVIDIMQLIVGFLAMVKILEAFKVADLAGTFPIVICVVPLWIVCTCLLSVPMVLIIHYVSIVIGHVLPEAGTCVFCGCWSGFVFEFSGRSVEGGLHHAVGHVVDKTVGRFIALK